MRETEMMEQAVEIEYFGGLYIFTMKDANNNVHTCTGHSGRETIITWKWFLDPIFRLIVKPNNMALISDEHTSICPAIAAVDPSFTKWSACITHRKGNVVKRCGKVAGELFKKAAFAYTLIKTNERHYYRAKNGISKSR